ncbi:MAG: AIR synthase related protein [Candidatus Heimdallarchaeota archaeon]
MLETIANSIRNNKNVIEKKDINPFVQFIHKNSYKNERIYSDIGEDSAAIKDNNKYILLTTDRIKTEFVENHPYGAGFSSLLVGVDDIYCCGGTPLAASIIISYKEINIGHKIIEGICEASQKFQIPVIRGHTKPKSNYYELSSTIIGEIEKKNYISALNAQFNDDIILSVDFDGKIGKASEYYWDTVTFKSTAQVLHKRKSMHQIAKQHLANSSKDISNGGIFGTLLQLIRYSKVGANVNINNIEIPPILRDQNYSLEKYLKMYLTTSYILTASEQNSEKILETFLQYGLFSKIIGKIIKGDQLKINNGKDSLTVMRY